MAFTGQCSNSSDCRTNIKPAWKWFPYWHKSKGDNRHTEANHLWLCAVRGERDKLLIPGLSRRMEPWDAQQEAKKEAGRRGGLVNQQRIRDAKTSSALANKLNKENKENPLYLPKGRREEGRRRFFWLHRSTRSTDRRIITKAWWKSWQGRK